MKIAPINLVNFSNLHKQNTIKNQKTNSVSDTNLNNSADILAQMSHYIPSFAGADPNDFLIDGKKIVQDYYLKLKKVPSQKEGENKYSEIEAYCNIPVELIEQNYNEIMPDTIKLIDNRYTIAAIMQKNKEKVLNFLKILYENPRQYAKNIQSMDPIGQGIEWAYPAIQEINRLKDSGYALYITVDLPKNEDKKARIDHAVKMERMKCIRNFNLFDLANVDAKSKKDAQSKIDTLMIKAEDAKKGRYDNDLIDYCIEAIDMASTYSIAAGHPYALLGKLDYILQDYEAAKKDFNKAINEYCKGVVKKYISKDPQRSLKTLHEGAEKYTHTLQWEQEYVREKRSYDNMSIITKLISQEPIAPKVPSSHYKEESIIYKDIEQVIDLFKRLSVIYNKLEQTQEANACMRAIELIQKDNNSGNQIIMARAKGDNFLDKILNLDKF